MYSFYGRHLVGSIVLAVIAGAGFTSAQTTAAVSKKDLRTLGGEPVAVVRPLYTSVITNYLDETDGIMLSDIIKLALENNGEIKIARLDVEKAKARLTQAGLRSNPTLEVEHSSGRIAGSPGEGQLSVGVSLPLDVYGQRGRRIDLAKAEITLKTAEVSARQRDLTAKILAVYTEALVALREIQILEELLDLDTKTVQFVQFRVNEGETAPLEISLLQTEVDRLRARRLLTEGKLQTAISTLKFYAGIAPEDSLKLREDISTAAVPLLPPTLETSIISGLQNRPEIRLAQLDEELAAAGLRLIRSQSRADVTAFTRYSQGRLNFDDPRGQFFQRDRSLTFGMSIGLPVFNRNQGAKAEAEITIRQAQERRIFAEQIVRNQILTAFQRIEAAQRSRSLLETAVLPRSRENVETIRKVYEIGELKITDLIAEQRKLLDASRDLTETLAERYRAGADLFIAIGLTFEN